MQMSKIDYNHMEFPAKFFPFFTDPITWLKSLNPILSIKTDLKYKKF